MRLSSNCIHNFKSLVNTNVASSYFKKELLIKLFVGFLLALIYLCIRTAYGLDMIIIIIDQLLNLKFPL